VEQLSSGMFRKKSSGENRVEGFYSNRVFSGSERS
jgi:hypothetical protein